jgi:hypothetical protein
MPTLLINGKPYTEKQLEIAVRRWLRNPALGTVGDILEVTPPGMEPEDFRTIATTLAEDPTLLHKARLDVERQEGSFGDPFIWVQLVFDIKDRLKRRRRR